jgi:DNA-binding transcriptional LysR family regulator
MPDNKPLLVPTVDANSILVYVTVAKAGSFTQAARALSMPVSTVSDRVSALEKQLGVTLINRTTRKLHLTEVGRQFLEGSAAGMDILLAAYHQASTAQHTPTGTLRITAPADFASDVIASAIVEYREKFPQVRVVVHPTNRFVDLVAENCDIAIRGGHLADSGLLAKRVGGGRMILVTGQKYLRKAKALEHPRDLKDRHCIGFVSGEGEEQSWSVCSTDSSFKIQPSFAVAASSFGLIIELVQRGEGIALVPEHLIKAQLKNKELVRVLPRWATVFTPVHLVYPAQKYALPKVREMISILANKLTLLLDAS